MSGRDPIQIDVPLATKTSLGVGGVARRYAEASGLQQLLPLLARAAGEHWPIQMLGAGSNVLFSDAGVDALVLRWTGDRIEVLEEGATVRLLVGAGCDWDRLVARCVESGWAGIECLSGIPGTVGAAPIQNIGAYGQEISQSLHCVHALRLPEGEQRVLQTADCSFGYRDSRFKREAGWIVTAIELRLVPGGRPSIRYGDLERTLAEREGPTTLAKVRDAVLAIRATKGMLLDPADPDSRSAGSFFTNPTVDAAVAARLSRELGTEMPAWPQPGDDRLRKLSAAWLIERCGFTKGQRLGGARISRKHVLALVNSGEATALELLELAQQIHLAVLERTEIALEVEPRLVGFTEAELGPFARARRSSS